MNNDKLRLDENSLEFLLNFIMTNLKEDRRMALEHHEVLSSLLNGAPHSQGLSGLEIQMMLEQLSNALQKFMQSASTSTDQAIKIAKIMSDILIKSDPADSLTDAERADIERLMGGLQEEKDKIGNIIDMDTGTHDR